MIFLQFFKDRGKSVLMQINKYCNEKTISYDSYNSSNDNIGGTEKKEEKIIKVYVLFIYSSIFPY